MPHQQNQIQIKANDEELKGRYSNLIQISHSPEEFVMDFMYLAPNSGQLVSRIVTSPGHMKRLLKAIQNNIEIYEKNIESIEEANEPNKGIGFKTSQ